MVSDKKTQKSILLLHGALGIAQDLNSIKQVLEEKGYRVLSFDFSGHGKSSVWPNEFRIDLFARDLDHFIRQHNLKDLEVFGHSMGGYVALYYQANFEDSPLNAIYTYGTKFNWSEKVVQKEIHMLNPEQIADKFPAHAKLLQEKHGDQWKALLRSTAHMMQHLEKLDGLTKEDLCEVGIPVLLMLGDQDRMVTSEETQLTASWMPHAKVKIISHSKHELERTNLKEMIETFVDFLN